MHADRLGYVRVSGAGQVANGDGLGVQREKIGSWCMFAGLALEGVEADEGISGATVDNRPALRRVLRAVLCAEGGATLVVYKLGRCTRYGITSSRLCSGTEPALTSCRSWSGTTASRSRTGTRTLMPTTSAERSVPSSVVMAWKRRPRTSEKTLRAQDDSNVRQLVP
ncbi:MAG: recombinase family protein [Deltaproteobacteria bacterium]|nr:recombinase family protein [Deltaproteobacteria bacterium]